MVRSALIRILGFIRSVTLSRSGCWFFESEKAPNSIGAAVFSPSAPLSSPEKMICADSALPESCMPSPSHGLIHVSGRLMKLTCISSPVNFCSALRLRACLSLTVATGVPFAAAPTSAVSSVSLEPSAEPFKSPSSERPCNWTSSGAKISG